MYLFLCWFWWKATGCFERALCEVLVIENPVRTRIIYVHWPVHVIDVLKIVLYTTGQGLKLAIAKSQNASENKKN